MFSFERVLATFLLASSVFAVEDNLVRIRMNKIYDDIFVDSILDTTLVEAELNESRESRQLRGKDETETVKNYKNAQYFAEVDIGT